MKRVHYTDSYLLVPQHPVTVNLIVVEVQAHKY